MKIAIPFLLVLLTAAGSAQNAPGTGDGNELLKECSPLIKQMDSNTNSADFFADYQRVRNTYICPPKGSTYGQHARVLVKALNDHPQSLHEPAGLLTSRAFLAAYPCPVRSAKPTATKK